jgi:hypothetical protein
VIPLYIGIFFVKKNTKVLIFGGISKVSSLGTFGQFWAKFVALTVAESLPEARMKSLKSHNS